MIRDDVTHEELETVGPKLLQALAGHFTDDDVAFLISFKAGKPLWERFSVPAAKELPAVSWKLHNIAQMKPEKHEEAQARLKAVLEGLTGRCCGVPSTTSW